MLKHARRRDDTMTLKRERRRAREVSEKAAREGHERKEHVNWDSAGYDMNDNVTDGTRLP